MNTPDFPQEVSVNVGDIVRTEGDPTVLSVVFNVSPLTGQVALGSIVRDDEGNIERLTHPGTYSDALEVLGSMPLDELVDGYAKTWPQDFANDYRATWSAQFRQNYEQGPMVYENNIFGNSST